MRRRHRTSDQHLVNSGTTLEALSHYWPGVGPSPVVRLLFVTAEGRVLVALPDVEAPSHVLCSGQEAAASPCPRRQQPTDGRTDGGGTGIQYAALYTRGSWRVSIRQRCSPDVRLSAVKKPCGLSRKRPDCRPTSQAMPRPGEALLETLACSWVSCNCNVTEEKKY